MGSKRFCFLGIILLILGLSQYHSLAQTSCKVLLEGQVLEQGTHRGVSFASVYIPSEETGVQSDEKGYFSIELLCDTIYTMQVSQFDYQLTEVQVTTTQNDISQRFYLKPKDHQLSTVTVHAHQEKQTIQTNIVETLGARELNEQAGRSLAESVEGVSGVFNIKTGPGINKPMIHGLYGSRIQIVNNEVAQMGQQWGADHAPEIDPFLAANIQVLKGAASVKHGPRAIGGVLLVNPEALVYDSVLHGKANLVGMSNGLGGASAFQLSGGVKLKNDDSYFNWRAQSSVKKRGDQHTPVYNLTNTASSEFNYSLAANYINKAYQLDVFYSSFQTSIGILRGAHVGNTSDLIDAVTRRPPFYTEDFSYSINSPRQKVLHKLLKTKLHFDWQNIGTVNVIYSFQQNNRQEYDIRRSSTDDRPNMDLQLNSHLIKTELAHPKLFNLVKGELGLNYEYQNNFSASQTGSPPLIPNYQGTQAGLFISEYVENEQWLFELGARYDFQLLDVLKYDSADQLINPKKKYNLFSIIAGTSYELNKRIKLKANLSMSERAPNINELYSQGLHHNIAALEFGDEHLEKEKNYKAIVTASYQHEEQLSFSADIHYSRYKGYIFLMPNGLRQTIRGAFPVYNYDQTDANLAGADLKVRYEFFHHLVASSQVSVIRAYDTENKQPLIFMPSDRWRNTLNWRIDGLEDLKELNFNLIANKVFKQYRAPQTEIFPFNDSTRIAVPDGYFTLDFSFSATKKLGNAQLTVGGSVYNIFNVAYTDYLNRLRYYAEEPGRNFELRVNYIF